MTRRLPHSTWSCHLFITIGTLHVPPSRPPSATIIIQTSTNEKMTGHVMILRCMCVSCIRVMHLIVHRSCLLAPLITHKAVRRHNNTILWCAIPTTCTHGASLSPPRHCKLLYWKGGGNKQMLYKYSWPHNNTPLKLYMAPEKKRTRQIMMLLHCVS